MWQIILLLIVLIMQVITLLKLRNKVGAESNTVSQKPKYESSGRVDRTDFRPRPDITPYPSQRIRASRREEC